MKRLSIVRNIACLLALVSNGFGPGVSMAQTLSIDPLGTAVPVAQRPANLREARDSIPGPSGKGLRMRAEVWLKDNQVQSNFFFGEYWHDTAVQGVEVEQAWLLYPGGMWTTQQIARRDDGQYEIKGAPALPLQSPVDVVVKLKGEAQLIQVRYRVVYPRG